MCSPYCSTRKGPRTYRCSVLLWVFETKFPQVRHLRLNPGLAWWHRWIRTQRTRAWPLIQEDSTSLRATKSMHHTYWACDLEPGSCNYQARMLQILKSVCLETVLNKRSHFNDKSVHRQGEGILHFPKLEKACPAMKPAAAVAKSLQLCPTLCDPIDGSPPVSSIPGILQAGILEWVAISFSKVCGLPFLSPKYACMLSRFSRVQLCATP